MLNERMEALAQHMEGLPAYRSGVEGPAVLMSQWRSDDLCGTVGCIAGHAEALFGARAGISTKDRAQQALGLTPYQVSALFYPPNIWGVTGDDCARVIRVAACDDTFTMAFAVWDAWQAIADEIDERGNTPKARGEE